ncbi:hypothetical protein TrRE_jg11841 [Triparma retinervis]|uniref:Uncharacterized protein n=1 Tax=Triparma retinervis TaxID=2557542 RepID=A0A9W7DR21_9STRA|nr:hypothetical protein TrRE_jg11841 [Triparma retinervis]
MQNTTRSLPQNLLLPSSITSANLGPLVEEVVSLLQTLDVGSFPTPTTERADLHSYVVTADVFRNFKARQKLYKAVASCPSLLSAYEDVIMNAVIPHIKRVCPSLPTPTTFFYQYPPSLRLQPGPSPHFGKTHNDAIYGHQDGEINFWVQLTDFQKTRCALMVESSPDKGDFEPLTGPLHTIHMFHGTRNRHFAPPNDSPHARVSLDFRVGIKPYFDEEYRMERVPQHTRRSCEL